MKKLTLAAVAAVAVGTAMAGASVTLGTPRQRYPWNGKMDIPYALTGTDAAKTYQLVTSLTVGGVTKAVTNELGAVADGGYTNTVDCAALFGTAVARETATVNLAVLTYGKPVIAITPVSKIWGPFLIINLTPNANGKFLATECDCPPDEAWTKDGGWADAYKRDYIVLRKVEAGTYPGFKGETKSTSGYWIGVFEVTEAQYDRVTGEGSSTNSLVAKGGIGYDTIRGKTYPSDSVTQTSFMGILCDRCVDEQGNKVEGFDLPTEWQWNIAYCAGTTSRYYWGDSSSDLDQYAWYDENSTAAQVVGLKKPNAWGLYDIAGNVQEWCRDKYDYTDANFENLSDADQYCTGANYGDILRSLRGGSFDSGMNGWDNDYRDGAPFISFSVYNGFRLSRMISK